jgi:hypothetical protein
MKKSRSSTPRFEARLPGFAGIAGPDLLDWEADTRVAMAVGKTLAIGVRKRCLVVLGGTLD